MLEELKLSEYAGQKCDVFIIKRKDGSVYVTFDHKEGYGHPALELDKLKNLVEKAEAMKK